MSQNDQTHFSNPTAFDSKSHSFSLKKEVKIKHN